MIEVAIVGLGSWGLCVMERTVNRARRTGKPVRLHLIEPAQLGGGVYSAEQPDFLILNNACGQLSLYAAPDGDAPPPYAVGLHQWAMVSGYRWVGYECRIGAGGEPIRPTDYLPRRLMGEYLVWFYDTLVDYAPTEPRDRPALRGGRRHLAGPAGTRGGAARQRHHPHRRPCGVDLGAHLQRRARGRRAACTYQRAYPIERLDQSAPAGSSVAVAGMGLVGFDVLTALTDRPRWNLRGPRRRGRPLAVRAFRPGAEHRPLLALGRAVLRQVRHRRRPLRPVPAGGVHSRRVRGADQSGRVGGAAARGLPGRAAAPALRRDAGALLHPGRLAGRGRRRVDRGPRRRCGKAGSTGTTRRSSTVSSRATAASTRRPTCSPGRTATTRRPPTTRPRPTT